MANEGGTSIANSSNRRNTEETVCASPSLTTPLPTNGKERPCFTGDACPVRSGPNRRATATGTGGRARPAEASPSA
eukprot:10727133-Prorocentrum_lima.AAC.1